MKKEYEKPTIGMMDYAQSDIIATGGCSGFLRTVSGGPCIEVDYRDNNDPRCIPTVPYEAV